MKWFRDMKIGLKLKVSFAILSLFIIVVGYAGIYNMKKVNENTKSIYKIDLISVKDMSEIKANIININLKMLQLINERDRAVQTQLKNNITRLKDEDDELLANYNKNIKTTDSRQMFNEFNGILNEYREKRELILMLINNEKYDEALSYYPKINELNNRIVKFLDEYVAFNISSAKVDYEDTVYLYKMSYILGVFIIILVVLFGTVISFSISSIISKQVNDLLIFAKAIGAGDLDHSIDINSEDELGQLSKALNQAGFARRAYELDLARNYEELESSYEEITALEEEIRVKYNELTISEEALRKSQEWYKLIAEASYDGLIDWDIKKNEGIFSERWYELLGYEGGHYDVEIKSIELIHPEDVDKVKKAIKEHWHTKSDVYKVEYRIKTKSGDYIWMASIGKTVFDKSGKPCRLVGSNKDITEIKEYQNKLQHIAYHDYLTGLPNRQYMYHKFDNDFIDKSSGVIEGAILFIDLDNFKNINDSMGHGVGDDLIIAIGKTLKLKVNKDNFLVRIGGDEFIFGIKNMPNKKEVEIFAKDIFNLLSEPFEINGINIQVTASIGISLFPEDGLTIDELLKKADIAMYQSKYHLKNRYTFFDEAMNNKILQRMKIESNLRNALINNEFMVYYQPQVDIISGKITSFEALIRWNNPQLGFVSPVDFIEVAEENQMILDIGHWVMKTACEFIKEMHSDKNSDCYISVNVSVLQFLQSDFIHKVFSLLEDTKLSPEYLELEITESIYIENYETICKKLIELREKGVRIALDDFGTGYSSLSYLKQLPIDTLKIDKSFIDDICFDGNKSLVEDIIKMGHKMQLNIIAEGVETKDQYHCLKDFKCNSIQGYLFSKPVPRKSAIELLLEDYVV